MSIITDPAREFTDLCTRLKVPKNTNGASYLASVFGMQSWSTDFMLVLASIHQQISRLEHMIGETELDEDIKVAACECLGQVRESFSAVGLSNPWSHAVQNYLTPAQLMPIRMVSAYVRPKYGYIVPDSEEVMEFAGMIEDLISWLRDAELTEKDFIRTALIEGLEVFLFRVRHVGWFGWPDTFDSLKAVVAAYLVLERGTPAANVSPPYDAMTMKVGAFLKTVFERVKFTKEVYETSDWLLKGYGALHVVGDTYNGIRGLLTHG